MMFLCLKLFNDCLTQTDKVQIFNEDYNAFNNPVADGISQLISPNLAKAASEPPLSRTSGKAPVMSPLTSARAV